MKKHQMGKDTVFLYIEKDIGMIAMKNKTELNMKEYFANMGISCIQYEGREDIPLSSSFLCSIKHNQNRKNYMLERMSDTLSSDKKSSTMVAEGDDAFNKMKTILHIPRFGEYKNRHPEYTVASDILDEIRDAMQVFNFVIQAFPSILSSETDDTRGRYLKETTMYSTMLNQGVIVGTLSKISGDEPGRFQMGMGCNSSLVRVKPDCMENVRFVTILNSINYHYKKQREAGGYHLISSKICDAVNRFNIAKNLYEQGNIKLLDYFVALENALIGHSLKDGSNSGITEDEFNTIYKYPFSLRQEHYKVAKEKVFGHLKHSNPINHYDNIDEDMLYEIKCLAMKTIIIVAKMAMSEEWKSVKESKGWITRFKENMSVAGSGIRALSMFLDFIDNEEYDNDQPNEKRNHS